MNVSLIIPAYNEEERIVPFIASIEQFIENKSNILHEIIVVNDGSTDATKHVAEEAGKSIPGFTVISLQQNQGKGAAVQAGVLAAKGDYIVFMDADGATAIDELPKMMRALETSDIAIGNRWMAGAKAERHSLLRQLSGFMYRNYMAMFGLGNIDTMCGFKGYKNHIAKSLFKDLQEKRWLFDTEIAYRAICRNHSVNNFPIDWESKDGSKLDTATLLKSALQIFPLILSIRRTESKKSV
ncbi:MAG: glycosyltransferase family 2 protein [bacterium]|nr:glycosyltransferase family 2 protein [bacterium]